jgi:HSP20 family molecular chaperone IbpA
VKEENPTVLSIHEPARQSRVQPGETECRETRFEHSPWINITRGERKNPLVTMWIGVKAIVIALSLPDGNPGDVQISIVGTCLLIRGTARSSVADQNIDLPCPVETHPIRIEDGRGTCYILLVKK